MRSNERYYPHWKNTKPPFQTCGFVLLRSSCWFPYDKWTRARFWSLIDQINHLEFRLENHYSSDYMLTWMVVIVIILVSNVQFLNIGGGSWEWRRGTKRRGWWVITRVGFNYRRRLSWENIARTGCSRNQNDRRSSGQFSGMIVSKVIDTLVFIEILEGNAPRTRSWLPIVYLKISTDRTAFLLNVCR